MREFVSVHHPIIWTGMKNITLMFHSIGIKVHFVSNVWMECKVLSQKGDNGIDSLMQWL